MIAIEGVSGFETIPVAGTAVGITASNIRHSSGMYAFAIIVQCTDGAIRWRCDGTAPTVSTGFLMDSRNNPIIVRGLDCIADFQAIKDQNSPGGGTLEVAYCFAPV